MNQRIYRAKCRRQWFRHLFQNLSTTTGLGLFTSRTSIVITLQPRTEYTLYSKMTSEGHLSLDNHLHPTVTQNAPPAVISHNANNNPTPVIAWHWHPRMEESIPSGPKDSLASQHQCLSTPVDPGVASEALVVPRHRVSSPCCSWNLPSPWPAQKCYPALTCCWMPCR